MKKCSDYTNLELGSMFLNSMGPWFGDCPEGPGTSFVGLGTPYGPFWDVRPGVARGGPGILGTLTVEI